MRTLETDDNNDLMQGADGNLSVIRGILAIGQTSEQFAKARRGEMIHKMDEGVPFAIVAWAGAPNLAQFEAVMRIRLGQADGVIAVTAFEVQQVGDVLGYTATLQTDSGEVTVNG